MAQKLGITPATAPQFILLAGMGYDIADVAAIMNSKGAEAWIQASENRNNPYFEQKGKTNTVKNARKLANVKGDFPKDASIKITLNDLNSSESKRNVIELLSQLDTMQAEMFRVNKIFSGHKNLETDPFVLEKQYKEAMELLNGEGMVAYSSKFKRNPLVRKYLDNHKAAIEVDAKTNINFSKTNRALVSELEDQLGKSFTNKALKKLGYKLNKINMLKSIMREYNFTPDQFEAFVYGGNLIDEQGNESSEFSVFEELLLQKALLQSENKTNEFLQDGIIFTNQNNTKSIKINPHLRENGNDEEINIMREAFKNLDEDLRGKLIMYDFLENGFKGNRSFFALFNQKQIDRFSTASDEMLVKKQSVLEEKSKRIDKVNRLTLSMHDDIQKVESKKLKRVVDSRSNEETWVVDETAGENFAEPGSELYQISSL